MQVQMRVAFGTDDRHICIIGITFKLCVLRAGYYPYRGSRCTPGGGPAMKATTIYFDPLRAADGKLGLPLNFTRCNKELVSHNPPCRPGTSYPLKVKTVRKQCVASSETPRYDSSIYSLGWKPYCRSCVRYATKLIGRQSPFRSLSSIDGYTAVTAEHAQSRLKILSDNGQTL
ncbi:hypothetical protein HC256_002512 [Beauveria bassiana]|nr:hypothetical protein HC256_002512 [Beauveria bassiana]